MNHGKSLVALLEAFAGDTKWEQERKRLVSMENPTINIETATFINNTMESYNNSVIDSIFTPVQKLKKFYKLYAVDQQKQYGPKCLKLIARIERWK